MRPRDLAKLLDFTIQRRLPVLVTGPPAVGKSEIICQAAARAGADVIVSHPVVADPTDAKGLPWPDREGETARFLPFGDLAMALAAKKPTVWFLDDLGQASPAVQASFMQLLLARRVNDHVLPDCVTFIAATNRRTDRAGVSGILEPVKSRFATIATLEVDLEDWGHWWMEKHAAIWNEEKCAPRDLLSFLRFRTHLLHVFEPTADLTNGPSPRTWNHACSFMGSELPPDVRLAALSGAVGSGAASELEGFLRTIADLQPLDEIIADPDHARIPPTSNPSARCAVATGLASKANVKTLKPILRYAERMYNEAEGGEYAALIMRDIFHQDTAQVLIRTNDWLQMTFGPLGALVSGQDFEASPAPAPTSRKAKR